MSYSTLKTQVSSRFNEVQVFLNFITSQEPSNPVDPTPMEVKIMRGLFYVHLYGALEKSVNEVVQYTLSLISSKAVKHNHFQLAFSTISVGNKLKALKDSGYKKFLSKSIEIFDQVSCTNICQIDETTFSNYLQNIWVNTLEEVRLAFGMAAMTISPQERATINEIVEKRNEVAHGRESALIVGERHRTDVLRVKLQIIQNFTFAFIDEFEDFYTKKKYLKPAMKKHYV